MYIVINVSSRISREQQKLIKTANLPNISKSPIIPMSPESPEKHDCKKSLYLMKSRIS